MLAALPLALALGLCAGAALLTSILASQQPNTSAQLVAQCAQTPNGSVLPLTVYQQTLPARAIHLTANQLFAQGPQYLHHWSTLSQHYATHLESLIYHECRGDEIGRQ